MHIEHEIRDDVDIVFLNGRIDAQSASGVNQEIGTVLDGGRDKMLIDFKSLNYISSAGLRVLISELLMGQSIWVDHSGGGFRDCL